MRSLKPTRQPSSWRGQPSRRTAQHIGVEVPSLSALVPLWTLKLLGPFREVGMLSVSQPIRSFSGRSALHEVTVVVQSAPFVPASDNSIRNMEEERTELRQGRTATASKATAVLKLRQTNVSARSISSETHQFERPNLAPAPSAHSSRGFRVRVSPVRRYVH
jgi:hypothetical protein